MRKVLLVMVAVVILSVVGCGKAREEASIKAAKVAIEAVQAMIDTYAKDNGALVPVPVVPVDPKAKKDSKEVVAPVVVVKAGDEAVALFGLDKTAASAVLNELYIIADSTGAYTVVAAPKGFKDANVKIWIANKTFGENYVSKDSVVPEVPAEAKVNF